MIPYVKQPLSINEQILRLEGRGLNFCNKELAAKYLHNISYYRLRAFTYPFQENDNVEANHHFKRDDIDFFDIIDLYLFDRRLRNLVFNEIEKIEVSVRTIISQTYSLKNDDSHWYLDNRYFSCDVESLQKEIEKEVRRSNEDFIKHYFIKYDYPELPPSWMVLEVTSFGTISRLYKYLKKSPEKKKVALYFGIADVEIFANWLHALSNLRNYCAHHSRIWNRRYPVHIILPRDTINQFIPREHIIHIKQNKIFALLSAIKYLADIISPGNNFKGQLYHLLESKHNLLSLGEMGFPDNWKSFPIWE